MAWIAPIAGAVIGGIMSNQAARTANRGAGEVNIRHGVDPVAGSDFYRNQGAAAAYNLLQGSGANTAIPPGAPGYFNPNYDPNSGGSGTAGGPGFGGGNGPDVPIADPDKTGGTRVNRRGQTVPVRNPAGGRGGGGGGRGQQGFTGRSPETQAAIDNASRVAQGMETSPVVTAAQGYTADTLSGQDRNPYRQEAQGYLEGLTDDPNYDRYIEMLFGSDTGLQGGGGANDPNSFGSTNLGGGGGGGVHLSPAQREAAVAADVARANGQPPPGTATSGPTAADEAIKRILAGEDVPGAQAMRDRIRRQAEDAFNEQTRQRRLEASGSGMYGGTGQLADEAFAQGRFGSGLADAYAAQDYNLYAQALGLGTQYDTATLDRAAQERMNAANNATSAAGIGAGAAAEAAGLASRERMARLGALGEAIGLGSNVRGARATGLGALSEGFSGDQRAALAGAGDTNALGQAGYLNAGALSQASDQTRSGLMASLASSRAQAAAARGAQNIDQQRLDFQRQQWQHDVPWQDVGRYQAIISGTYDPYATSWEQGTDRRNASPVNVGAQTLSGAMGGYYLGQDIYNNRGGGGGGGSVGAGYGGI